MRLPPKDDPGGDREGRLPRDDVITVLRRHGVSVDLEHHSTGGDVCCTFTSDTVCEVHFLPDPVGGLMVKHLARKFEVSLIELYYFRQLDAQEQRGPLQ